MKSYKHFALRRLLFFFAFAAVCILGIAGYWKSIVKKMPKHIYVGQNDETVLDINIPVTGHVYSYEYDNFTKEADFSRPVTIITGDTGHYSMKMKLFGVIELNTVDIEVVDEKMVYPGGFQTGLYMKSDGAFVVNVSSIKQSTGIEVTPADNILMKGDYILSINGKDVTDKKMLSREVAGCDGQDIILKIKRNEQIFDVSVRPVLGEDNVYKLGIWVKDDAQGIGSITYIDGDGNYGALGHGISDSETDNILKIKYGKLYKTRIISIIKGKNGTPGELLGTIEYKDENVLGTITKNTSHGIYGKIDKEVINKYNLELMKTGYSHNVKKKSAYVRMYINDSFCDYEIEITDINNASENKNITFKVVSEQLLDKTNGIVQGMSGCPIIQDGKVIGAVTHVFVDDPTCGYGIFIEKML